MESTFIISASLITSRTSTGKSLVNTNSSHCKMMVLRFLLFLQKLIVNDSSSSCNHKSSSIRKLLIKVKLISSWKILSTISPSQEEIHSIWSTKCQMRTTKKTDEAMLHRIICLIIIKII